VNEEESRTGTPQGTFGRVSVEPHATPELSTNEHHGLTWAALESISRSRVWLASSLCTLTFKTDFSYAKKCTMVYLSLRYT
jgi:hypothetical protein